MLNQMESDMVMDLEERAKKARDRANSYRPGTKEYFRHDGRSEAFFDLAYLIRVGGWAPLKKKKDASC